MMFASPNSDQNQANERWLSDRIGEGRGWDTEKCATLAGRGWVVLYHDYRPEAQTICLSAASDNPKWLTRDVIFAMFDYPFSRAHCQAVILQVSEHNDKMLGIARRFGFDMTLVPRLRGINEGEYVCLLTREKWAVSPFARAVLQRAA